MCGPYYIPNIKADVYAVFTNCVPSGAMRGYGVPQATFALESLMDELAGRLALDPIELRMRNALDTRLPNTTGQVMSASVPIKKMLGKANLTVQLLKSMLEQIPTKGKLRGIGVGCSSRGVGSIRKASRSTAIVTLHPDGSATVACGHVDLGQGSDSMMAQVAAEELGLDLDRVTLVTNDTAISPDCESTSASRVTYLSGNAVRLAAMKARQRVLELAAQDLGCVPEGLRLINGAAVYREQAITLAELFSRHTFHSVTSVAEFLPDTVPPDPETGQGKIAGTYNFNVHIALVEVDAGTGRVRILRYVALTDVGQMINPLSVEGQVHGGIMMGLGSALMEEVRVQDGRVANTSFATYLTPTAFDVPQELLTVMIEDPEPTGPYGAKGFAEGALDPVGATIANAISNAIGARVRRLPMTSERIHELLAQRSRMA